MVDATDRLVATASDTVALLTAALEQEPQHAEARGTLASYYYDRFVEAETQGDREGSNFHRRSVELYHDGKYTRELRGDGTLRLTSEPAAAEVTLYELVEASPAKTAGAAD